MLLSMKNATENSKENAIEQYRQLRSLADDISESLTAIHGENIVCRKGCCGCCVNLSVFPVEFNSILDELRSDGVEKLEFDESASCGFLKDGLCSIYKYRPLICRTHGLPIAFLDDEADPPAYSVSFCDENFTSADPEDMAFGPDNTLNIDDLNSSLYSANLAYIEAAADDSLNPSTRIELKELVKIFA